MPTRLPLCALLSTTALVALSLAPLPAAAACVDAGTTVTCTGPDNAAITNGTDGKTFTIAPDSAIGPLNGRALTLSGSDQNVVNDGLIESLDDVAIRGRGTDLTITNTGTIRALNDRAIRLQQNADNFTLINGETGQILSKDQAVRLDNDDFLENALIINHGLIDSLEGRAIQSRGPGTTVINHGTLIGGEEVIEGQLDFTLENYGTIRLRDGVADEDGVQFASGRVENWGLIQGSDDGVDLDEGTVINHKTGIIRVVPALGEPGGYGIDVDEVLQTPGGDVDPGPVFIENAGLIEGPKAIGVDEARTAGVFVKNSGTLRGYTGVAIEFNPEMEATTLELFDHSMIFGAVLLTDNDDTVTIGAMSPGQSGLFTDAFFDGRGGSDTVILDGYDLSDITRFMVSGNRATLTLASLAGNVRGEFRNFDFWTVGGETYTTAALSALAPVPLPAGLPLLGAGLVGLWALRRRAA